MAITPTLDSVSFVGGSTLTYEEGTWTPVDGSGAGLSLTIVGTSIYRKIASLVWASCHIVYPTTANGTTAQIGGLPYTIFNNDGNRGGGVCTYTGASGWYLILPIANTKTVEIGNTAGALATNANMSTAHLLFSVFYSIT